MKKALTKVLGKLYHYHNGKMVFVDPADQNTYPEGLIGNISDELYGNISGLYGNITGIKGRVTGISGNLDDCEISDEEREQEVDIEELLI